MTHVDWRPDARKLRQFAAVWLIGFMLIGLLAAWKGGALGGSGAWAAPAALWVAAVVVGLAGWIAPELVRPVYLAWSALGLVTGAVVSYALLALVFFGLFTPVALFFRLIGRDVLRRRFDASADTYWLSRPQPPAPARYFRQF